MYTSAQKYAHAEYEPYLTSKPVIEILSIYMQQICNSVHRLD